MFCECICPIKLHPFPWEMKDPERMKKHGSQTSVGHHQQVKKKTWTPKPEDMVCNKYFMHGCPTQDNQDPNLLLGHDKIKKSKSARRVLCNIDPNFEQ